MFSRRECVKDAFIICPQGHRHKMTYVLDNTDDSDVSYLCSLLSKNDCDISIFWQSKFDRNYMQQEEPKVYDAAPFIQNGRTYTPVRFLEDIGFEVEWIENEQKVIIRK